MLCYTHCRCVLCLNGFCKILFVQPHTHRKWCAGILKRRSWVYTRIIHYDYDIFHSLLFLYTSLLHVDAFAFVSLLHRYFLAYEFSDSFESLSNQKICQLSWKCLYFASQWCTWSYSVSKIQSFSSLEFHIQFIYN